MRAPNHERLLSFDQRNVKNSNNNNEENQDS